MNEYKSPISDRDEFKRLLASEPQKLEAYETAMSACAGDWLTEALTHFDFLAAYWNKGVNKEKR